MSSLRERFSISLPKVRRPMTVAFVLALVVHLPLTPLFPLLRVLQRFAIVREQHDWDYQKPKDDVASVPIELVSLPKVETKPAETTGDSFALPPPPPSPSEAAKAEAKKADAAKSGKGDVKFAEGASKENAEKEGDGDAPGKKKHAKKGDGEKKDEKKEERERVGLQGTKDRKIIGKPNVTFAMWLEPVRTHALGAAVNELFACNPEWKPILQQGIKPLDDLDGMMVSTPQLSDATRATVALQHHLNGETVHGTIDALVQRGHGGKWLDDDTAKIVLLRKERVVFPHEKDMVFVAPPDGWQAIHDVKDPLSLPPADGRAFSLTLQSPARPLKKLGVSLPKSLGEMRLDVFANADGSVDLEIDFEDGSVEAAKADAPAVTKTIDQMFSDLSTVTGTADSLALLGAASDGEKLRFPEADFDPVDTRITTMMHFSTKQSARVLGLLAKAVCPKKKPAKKE